MKIVLPIKTSCISVVEWLTYSDLSTQYILWYSFLGGRKSVSSSPTVPSPHPKEGAMLCAGEGKTKVCEEEWYEKDIPHIAVETLFCVVI